VSLLPAHSGTLPPAAVSDLLKKHTDKQRESDDYHGKQKKRRKSKHEMTSG
jgi:hypothetical protein